MDTVVCPKCGSDNRERGKLFPGPWGFRWDIRFQAENAYWFNNKDVTTAIACMSCGYIELYLSKVQAEYQNNT